MTFAAVSCDDVFFIYLILGRLSRWVGVHTNQDFQRTEMKQPEEEYFRKNEPRHNSISSSVEGMKYLEKLMDDGLESNIDQLEWNYEVQILQEPAQSTLRRTQFRRQIAIEKSDLDSLSNTSCETLSLEHFPSQSRTQANKKSVPTELESATQNLIEKIESKYHSQDIKQEGKLEWRQAAMVFDKLGLYMYLIIFLTTTIYIYSNAPKYVS